MPWSGYATLPVDPIKVPTLQLGPVALPTSGPLEIDIPDPSFAAVTSVQLWNSDSSKSDLHRGSDYFVGGIAGNVVTFAPALAGKIVLISYSLHWNPTAWSVGYGGTAYVISPRANLGSSNTLKNYVFEVQGFYSGAGGLANPADIVRDLIANA